VQKLAQKVKPEKTENRYHKLYRERTRKVEMKEIGYLNGQVFTY
jgi:hypothetical protein